MKKFFQVWIHRIHVNEIYLWMCEFNLSKEEKFSKFLSFPPT